MNKEYMGLADRIKLSIKENKSNKELKEVLKHYQKTGRVDNVTLLHKVGIRI